MQKLFVWKDSPKKIVNSVLKFDVVQLTVHRDKFL